MHGDKFINIENCYVSLEIVVDQLLSKLDLRFSAILDWLSLFQIVVVEHQQRETNVMKFCSEHGCSLVNTSCCEKSRVITVVNPPQSGRFNGRAAILRYVGHNHRSATINYRRNYYEKHLKSIIMKVGMQVMYNLLSWL